MNGNLGIGDLTIGIDSAGMTDYIADLRMKILTEVQQIIEDVAAVETAINNAWSGVSKDRYIESFQKSRTAVINDLEKEFANVTARLNELQTNYYKQDQQMIVE